MADESVSILDHINSRITDLRELIKTERAGDAKALGIALEAAEKALVLARDSQDDKNKHLNELRNMALDQSARLATKEHVDAEFKAVRKEISDIRLQLQGIEARALGRGDVVKYLVIAATLGAAVATIASFLFR